MYNKNIIILVSENMKTKLKAVAESEDKTISDYVRGLITKDLQGRK